MAMELKGKEVKIEEKVPTLPEDVTLEYFYKALCNRERSRIKTNYTFILD